ncbi:chitinase, partial [Streptomyces regensis]
MSAQPSSRSVLFRTALAAAVAVSAGVLAASPAQAATGTITGLAGKCLDVAGANSADGTPVQLYDCNGTNAQQWTVGSDGTIRA